MKLTNKRGLPNAIYNAVQNDDYDGPSVLDDGIFSVTSLLNPPHQRLLKRKFYNYLESDVEDKIWILFGKGVHSVMESGADPGDVCEKRYEHVLDVLVNGEVIHVTISGAIDYYNSLLKKIQDYKTCSAYALTNDRILQGYMWQLNFYAYMLRQKGIEVKGVEDIFFVKDYSKRKKNAPGAVVVHEFELKSDVEIEDKIKQLIVDHYTLDQVCTPEERWAKESTKAVMKHGRKSAVKVFKDNPTDSEVMDFIMEQKGDLSKFYVEDRPGEDIRCESYCDCNNFCSYYNKREYEGRKYLEKPLTKKEIKQLESK